MTLPPSNDASKTAVHPLNFCKDEWRVSQRSIYSGNLIVLHDVQPPNELKIYRHTHHTLFLSLTNSPRQITRIVDQQYEGPMNEGDLFLMPAGCPSFNAWETTNEAIIFLLTPDFLQRTAAQTECLNPDQIELRPVLIDQDLQIEKIARLFCDEMKTEGLGDRLYNESLANCLAIHLLRNYSTTSARLRTYEGGLSRKRLRQALGIIHASLDQSLRLETVADELGLDIYYFSRLFRQSMGVSPYQYVLRQRVEKAKRLLSDDELSITEISMECGFANPSHLAKHFRKSTGVSPKVYRQQGAKT